MPEIEDDAGAESCFAGAESEAREFGFGVAAGDEDDGAFFELRNDQGEESALVASGEVVGAAHPRRI